MAGATLAAAMLAPPSASAATVSNGPVTADITDAAVVLGNGLVERRWKRAGLSTAELRDLRGPDKVWSRDARDFTLRVGGVEVGSESFTATGAKAEPLANGGVRVEMELTGGVGAPPGLTATRIAEAYPGIAGFRTQTVLRSAAPLTLAGATLDEAVVSGAAASLHAFRAGADWREPGYAGPPVFVGNPHPGTWRDTVTGPPVDGPGQWLSLKSGGDSLFLVMERNDFPSSRASYDGSRGRLEVDYSRDVLSLGPFEENAHVENNEGPDGNGRQRTLRPGEPFALEPAFTGVGRGDGDEEWQFHSYLTGPRGARYRHEVTFNSNGTDGNVISTGAKDDMDYATVQQVAPIAKRLGIETFILDDGWQAISGDWQPDSPDYPEPRYQNGADPKFKPRFPDSEFKAVREAIAPMRLGLWMSPLSFNPQSETYRTNPNWACSPAGQGTTIVNALDPESSSNEAGIGVWGKDALPHIEARIRHAIEKWGVTYFKFDFIVWLDCAGQNDLYELHDAFVAMLDRLRKDHPDVVFQIDETNDYRMFPFESVARGPSWFQNGSPTPDRLLHNLWNLSPWVPSQSLGQHFLGGNAHRTNRVDTLMAIALLSHMTYFSDLRSLPDAVVDQAAPWIEFYKQKREFFEGVVYPLLDDPLKKDWTALQAWDPERARGSLLAFRQDGAAETRTIALRNVPPGRTFELFRGPDGTLVDTVSSEELSSGIEISLPDKGTARVLTIVPVPLPDRSGGSAGGQAGAGQQGAGNPSGIGRQLEGALGQGKASRCAKPTGSVRGQTLGPAGLGRSRSAQRRAFPSFTRRRAGVDRFCIQGGGNIRIGYMTGSQLSRLARRRRRGQRAVLVLTTSRHYAIRGIRHGSRVRTLRRRLRGERSFRIGRNRWFVARGRRARLVLKTHKGRVEEVGIAERRPTRTARRAKRFLRKFPG